MDLYLEYPRSLSLLLRHIKVYEFYCTVTIFVTVFFFIPQQKQDQVSNDQMTDGCHQDWCLS